MESSFQDTAEGEEFDHSHRPFKAWALQQDLNSLLGADPSWNVDANEIGLEPEAKDESGKLRGQDYLSRKLKPGARLATRKATSAALWTAALAITCLNQCLSFGLSMSGTNFLIAVGGMLSALFLATLAFPFLSKRVYPYFEELLLLGAIALIVFQTSVTGGADSPYAVWLVFTTFYSAYFMGSRLVAFNTALAALVALLPIAYAPSEATGYAVLYASILAGVIVMMALTVLYSRQLARRAKRGVKFLALADRLTGVANLRAFEHFTADLSAAPEPKFAIAMVDMNGLKGANTVFGYATGDGMVVRLARLMLRVSPASSQVARIGGDEFAIVLPDSGESELLQWQHDFDQAVKMHNADVRGQLPQVSIAVGGACAPTDGADSVSLLDVADRRMYAQKTPAVRPPYELEARSMVPASRLLSTGSEEKRKPRSFGPSEYAFQAGALWLIIATGMLAWLVIPGIDVPYPTVTAILCVFSYVVTAIAFSGKNPRYRRLAWRVSDFSTLLIILPGLWVTGGWKSPFQLTLIIVIAYYAQFFRGPEMFIRIGGVLTLYSIAFWGTGPVSHAGNALFVTVVTAETVTAVILQLNARATDRSVQLIRDSATHDALTGAKNLYAFRTDLSALISNANRNAESRMQRPALIITDIDDFRKVNSRAGHRGGDAILKESIRRLETAVAPSGSKVYRIGGDEFAVLFSVDRFSEAADLAERCKRALHFSPPEQLKISGQIAASVGYSVLHDDMSLEQLVIAVETALAQGKSASGDVFSADTNVML